MFFGAAAISQGIEYCKRNVHTLGLRGEIGPAVTMARFVIAMARGERAIVAPVPITVAVDERPRDASIARSCKSRRCSSWCWGCGPYWGTEAAPLHYASVRASPRHWIKALPGLLRGRPNRYITPANGYESHNAHRLDIGLDSRFSSTARSFPRRPARRSRSTDGGTAEFVTLR